MATTTTHRTIALAKLTRGMIVRRERQGVPADYRVISVIREIHNRKTFLFVTTEPVDDTHPANALSSMAVYTSKTKPVVKNA
jgi:hypothetical protein